MHEETATQAMDAAEESALQAISDADIDEAWDDDSPSAVVDSDEEPQVETPVEPEPPQAPEPSQPDVEVKADQPELFTLKNRDVTTEVTREEVIALAQKGSDYDKVRTERDQLRADRDIASPVVELVESFAKSLGMDLPAYLDLCRKKQFVDGGMSDEAATEQVSLDKQRAQLDKDIASAAEKSPAQTSAEQSKEAEEAARKADIQKFHERFPKTDPNSIPKEVWDSVQNGGTLTDGFTVYENKRLARELAVLQKNKSNAQVSVGSLSGSHSSEQEEIDRIWAEDD